MITAPGLTFTGSISAPQGISGIRGSLNQLVVYSGGSEVGRIQVGSTQPNGGMDLLGGSSGGPDDRLPSIHGTADQLLGVGDNNIKFTSTCVMQQQ